MTPEEEKIKSKASKYVRDHAQEIIERFAGKEYPKAETPVSIFMAGSPGAGKTEISTNLRKAFEERGIREKFVRIDPDDIRSLLPEYTGSNSYLFQHASAIAADKIHDYVLHESKNFIFDSTFSNLQRARSNVERSLQRNRLVLIIYSYLNPFKAWELTTKREKLEGRHIPKEAFVRHFFGAKYTVDTLKKQYGEKVDLAVIYRDSINDLHRVFGDVQEIDKISKTVYNEDYLMRKL